MFQSKVIDLILFILVKITDLTHIYLPSFLKSHWNYKKKIIYISERTWENHSSLGENGEAVAN